MQIIGEIGLIEHINHKIYNLADQYEHVDIFYVNNVVIVQNYTADGLHLKYHAKKNICGLLCGIILNPKHISTSAKYRENGTIEGADVNVLERSGHREVQDGGRGSAVAVETSNDFYRWR